MGAFDRKVRAEAETEVEKQERLPQLNIPRRRTSPPELSIAKGCLESRYTLLAVLMSLAALRQVELWLWRQPMRCAMASAASAHVRRAGLSRCLASSLWCEKLFWNDDAPP